VLGLSACSSDKKSGSSAGSSNTELSLVGYSVPKPAYDALQDAFDKTAAGNGVSWKSSYGASGTQSKNISSGTAKADYVVLSVTPDLTKLVPKYVDADWNAGQYKGIVATSVVAIAVRKGNPLHITGWDDLIKPGVKIVTPSPSSSGSAKWNILAAYEHVIATGGTEAQATEYLKKFYANIVSRAASGSAATTQFLGGTGDVLISYENEAIASRQAGKSLDYVVPEQTFLIENPATITKNAPVAAKDFLAFTLSDQGQKIFASKGFRPVVKETSVGTVQGANDPTNPFPQPKKLTTIADLGGWTAVNTKFFSANGLVTTIEKSG